MPTLSQIDTTLTTAHLIDACMRLKIPFRIAPYDIKPLVPVNVTLSGPAVPVRHYGSVDIFLEVLESAPENGILIIDNENRKDEACIGDLAVLEMKHAGLQAVIVRGLHRDTAELLQIGFPVFSCGAYPSGPARLDERASTAMISAEFDNFVVTRQDTVFADQDGVIFIETKDVETIFPAAQRIKDTERQQADMAKQGISLRDQFQFKEFLKQREQDPDFTFRKHLSGIAKSIEE